MLFVASVLGALEAVPGALGLGYTMHLSGRSVSYRFGGRHDRGVASAWRRDPEFRSLVFLVLVTLLGGTIFYSTVEGWSVVDAFYFNSVTTLTTVGLGDLAPTTTMGKRYLACS
jgi:hypothetical protein